MRKVMGETNKVQRDHAEFMEKSEKQYQQIIDQGQQHMVDVMNDSAQLVSEVFDAMHTQEEQLSQFVTDMQKSMADMAKVNDTNLEMTRQMEHLSEMNGAVSGRLAELTELSEKYTRSLAQVQADNSDLSEGLSVMNDANIRMTDKISKMNDLTVSSLQGVQKAQSAYISAADGYLKSIQEAQGTLVKETKTQQENLRQFTDYMTQVLASMKALTESTAEAVRKMNQYLSEQAQASEIGAKPEADPQLAELIALLKARESREAGETRKEKTEEAKPRRRGLFGR